MATEWDNLVKAWDEAFNELPDSSEVVNISSNVRADQLIWYMAKNKSCLTKKEKDFLTASINIKKYKENLATHKRAK